MAWPINPRPALSIAKLRQQVDAALPNRNKDSDGMLGDAAHQSRTSDHNPWVVDGNNRVVTAIDITHDPKNGFDSYKFAEHLRQTKDPRVKYVISNKRIFSYEVMPWQWRKYTGSNPHDEHVHVSVRPTKSLYDWDKPWVLPEFITKIEADPIPPRPLLKLGATGAEVANLQKLLEIDPEYKTATTISTLVGMVIGKESIPWFGPRTENAVKVFQSANNLTIDGIVGPYTWRGLEGSFTRQVNYNIVATVFGGKKDFNTSAYNAAKVLNDTDLYVALPYRFKGKRPVVKVTNRSNGVSATATIEDVGPWLIDDPYWIKGDRPLAESGKPLPRGPNKGKVANRAGIDLSPSLAKLIDINGKGTVDWEFDFE